MVGISTLRKIRVFGPARQNSMVAYVHCSPAVFFPQDTAISGHQDRNGIGEKQHLCSRETSGAIQKGKTNAGVMQIHRFHELVKRHMGIEPPRADHGRNGDAPECGQRFAAEAGESQVEPDHVGLKPANSSQQAPRVRHAVESPATDHGEARQLRFWSCQIITENCQRQVGVLLQLTGNVKPVLIERFSARRKGGNQTDLHCWPGPKSA
jgi:hypothetical protein